MHITDKLCLNTELTAQPFGYDENDMERDEENIQKLVNFYHSFGFSSRHYSDKGEKYISQSMFRKKRC